MPSLASKRKAIQGLVWWTLLLALLGACEALPPPDGSLPDVSLPEVTIPDVTLPDVTTPDVTEPEATTPEETTPDVTEPEATTPEETTPDVTEPEDTTPPSEGDEEAAESPEEDETSPWLWVVLAAVVIGLLVAALTRRGAARSAQSSWNERARSALSGLGALEATLGRPATLDPADHEAVRRSVAGAREQSVAFEQLAATASDQALAQQAAATADALRVLATSSEIEVQGLASGTLSSLADREAAEAERRAHLGSLHQAADRLSQSLQ